MADFAKVLITKLDNGNYSVWKYKVKLLLIKEDLWNVISEEKPKVETQVAEWKRRDDRAMATIGLLVDDNQLIHIRNATSAKAAWNNLQNYHEKATLSNKVHLMRKICNMKLSNDGNLEDHINEMLNLFEKLTALGEEILTDKWIIAMLLSSLPSSYDTLITVLETRPEGDLTLDLVKGKLLEEYKRRHNHIQNDESKETALKLINSKKFQNKNDKKCYFCNKSGHLKKDCFKYKKWKSEKEKIEINPNNSIRKDTNKANQVKETENIINEFCFSFNNGNKKDGWYIDSGATCHISTSKSFFSNLDYTVKDVVSVANGQVIKSQGKGSGILHCLNNKDKEILVKVSDVLYIPNMEGNLLSVRKLIERGFHVTFNKEGGMIKKNETVVAVANLSNNLYKLKQMSKTMVTCQKHNINCQHIWHRIFGHRNIEAIKGIIHKDLATGIKISDCGIKETCEVCIEGKMSRLPFPQKSVTKTEPMELIHSDLCGPMHTTTPSGNRYVLTLIDDSSRYTKIFLLKHKSEVLSKIKEYVEATKTMFLRKPKFFRSDRGGEYVNSEMETYFKIEGIHHQYTTAYTPQQNGVAERKNRSLVEMTRCLLIDAGMDNLFWGEAMMTSNYLQNRLPTKGIEITPYEKWTGKKPDMSNLKIFGTEAYVHIPHQKRKKLDVKATRLIFVGYDEHSKAYRLVDIKTKKIIISRDVKFLDSKLINENNTSQKQIEINIQDKNKYLPEENQQLRISNRLNKGIPPSRLIEEINSVQLKIEEPKNLMEALSSEQKQHWIQAMKEEINSLKHNETWELVNLPADRKAIGCKWIYKVKRNIDGTISRYKARLVAQGFSQKYGIDYDEVFAPVVRQTTLRTFLSIAGRKNMKVQHFDILNGHLNEIIYMKLPPGFEVEHEHLVCKLKKSLYGLKQAARMWNQAINNVLLNEKFIQSKNDHCLYTKNIHGKLCFILIYVDDIIIASETIELIEEIGHIIAKKFEINNLGDIKYYLGLEVGKDSQGNYTLCQKNYINKLIKSMKLEDAKISNIPLEPGHEKISSSGEILINNEKYQTLIGSLLYIAVNTRPDIATSVSILGRKVSQPTKEDWNEAKRVVRYLKGTIDLKLHLSESNLNNDLLFGYADANWAEDKNTRKSNSGYIFMLNGGVISWSCKKQTCVALSSTEAEFIALAEATQEAIWLQRLLLDFNEDIQKPTTIFEDNQSCLKLIKTDKFSNRSKHIDTKFHFVKDHAERSELIYKYCSTEEMVGDLLTKPLHSTRLKKLREMCKLKE